MEHAHNVDECEGCAKVARSAILHSAGIIAAASLPIVEKYGTAEEVQTLKTTLRIMRAHAQSYMEPYADTE